MGFTLDLRMQQRVSPLLIMTSQLLQLSAVEFERAIEEELARNPALESVPQTDAMEHDVGSFPFERRSISSSSLSTGSADQGSDDFTEQVPARPSAIEQLIAEAILLVDRCDQSIAIYLLHALDGHGYLRRSSEELAAELGAPTATVQKVIHQLQELEPPGIAARDLRECLLIQCRHLEVGDESQLAQRILSETWDDFVHQRWGRIAQKLRVTRTALDQARRLMNRHLYPYPLNLLDTALAVEDTFSCADLIITRDMANTSVGYRLHIPAAHIRVAPDFEALAQSDSGRVLSTAEQAWVLKRVNRAHMFIKAIQQRWITLQRIGEFLISHQAAFLENGPLHLKPLTRTEVAEHLMLHESTVSRAIRDKVAQLPNGRLMPLSDFFDDAIVAKEAIRQLLTSAERPLKDHEIADILTKQGVCLARRTVTKYRRQLRIPAAHGRQSGAVLSGV